MEFQRRSIADPGTTRRIRDRAHDRACDCASVANAVFGTRPSSGDVFSLRARLRRQQTHAGDSATSGSPTPVALHSQTVHLWAIEWPLWLSVPPEALEAVRRELGVAHGVLDVLVPEVVLHGARVVPVVRELVAAGMAEHVRMHLQ